ncbi:TRAP transporter small permease [Stutzerimonas stutzeri]|uniref:TRAP transporter small permease protein n=1 Tax=Stutzerimonas stutzeri TaxID=316 RepID=A0A6I6LX07_STUST|nr:TRAP transporter small permease subunit [Stutzerimonas stutzeri]
MFRFLWRLSDAAAVAVGVLVVMMMVHITLEVFLRLIFKQHLPGTMEVVTYYYMVACIFVGIFSCTMRDAHIRVDVFAQFFKGKLRSAVDIFGWLVIAGYFGIFSFGLYRQADRSWQKNETVDAILFELPIWPARWLALIAITLAAIAAIIVLVHYYAPWAANNKKDG